MTNQRPNILFLFSDQHRFDALGCSGAQICRTPALDSLAESGLRFTHAFTPTALCSPARAALLSGLYPHNNGQLANMGNFNGVFDTQMLDATGYPQLLSAVGYSVNYVGKWHLPREGDADFWHFDQWFTDRNYAQEKTELGLDVDRSKEVQRLEWGGEAPFCGQARIAAEHLQEAWCADKTIDLLKTHADGNKPFMIFTSFFGPHFPYAVPAPYDTMYEPEQVERWPNFDETFENKPLIQQKEMLRWNASHLTWPDWQQVIAHYWGYCRYIDDQIARILTQLHALGLTDNTIVIYASDHGDMVGSHRLFNKGMYMYDEIYRIPLLIRWHGQTQPGTQCDEFVSLVDLMPTLLDVADAQVPTALDGRSIRPFLQGETVPNWPDDVFAEFHGYESTLYSQRMVRTKSWKYIYNPASEDELYDVASDPGELRNLANQLGYKHVLRRMKARLVSWLDRTHDTISEDDSWKGSGYDLYLSGREQ
ncbi:sulfatase-like hydrolase/transferase [Chloroflexi bacterium TSY]|nr:sulfatase-like hydrolase/transferase [Chloroflexi bacterium TSY]